ncbi:hypothetical protein AB4Y72_16075 [Arthrobacter sp. YAF34]|uniref:hypothetical protein n=1 Tax=Arthrobacter sp. YAF34 TaxID=3233083 RepID=UPI003F91ACF7
MKLARRVLGTLLLVGAACAASGASPAVAATAPDYSGVGSRTLASAQPGSRMIYVSTGGSDVIGVQQKWGYVEYNRITCLDTGIKPPNQPSCPEPDANNPLRTVQGAVKIAKPGDVIVVRGGVYDERVGWAARAGRSDARIMLQSYPKEKVLINGYLSLKGADYWTIQGVHFGYSSINTTGQALVNFFGGTGWSFVNNEIAGTRGVANLLIREQTPASDSVADRTAAAPHDYMIGGNCIHDAAKTGNAGEMHNIYLMPTIYSGAGTIENNLIAGAPLGANIKASGSSDPNGAPRDLVIRNNTLLYGASGLVIGQAASHVETIGNLIGLGINSGAYDGGVKTYALVAADTDSVKDTLIAGYANPIRQPWKATPTLFLRRNVTPSTLSLVGSVANCSARAADPAVRDAYGHLSLR